MMQEPDLPDAALEALRKEHHHLKQAVKGQTADLSYAVEIRSLLSRTRAIGAALSDEEQRRQAQRILDYWSTELVKRPGATAEDFGPVLLAKPEAKPPEQQNAQHTEVTEERSRQAIRIGALARLWRDSGKQPSYLPGRDVIVQAAKYRDLDPDIDDLVQASEERRKFVLLLASAIVATCILTAMACWAIWQWGLPAISNVALSRLKHPQAQKVDRERSLRALALIQPMLSYRKGSFNIAVTDLSGLELDGITLENSNFAYSLFASTMLRRAVLRNSSFYKSYISGATSFEHSELQGAQFEYSQIASSSFVEAGLERSSFDDAQLCDVDFSYADLREATFRRVMIGTSPNIMFRNTAWWLATGWDVQQLNALLAIDVNLGGSVRFQRQLGELKDAIKSRDVHSHERAVALNDMAWTLAIHGYKLGDVEARVPVGAEDKCLQDVDSWRSALLAAKQAVCIAEELNKSGAREYAAAEANFRDTLGYVLLQLASPDDKARIDEAVNNMRRASETAPMSLSADFFFRYAVALFAAGRKDEALSELSNAMDVRKYMPSHELVLLRVHISRDFEREIYKRIEQRSPAAQESKVLCPSK